MSDPIITNINSFSRQVVLPIKIFRYFNNNKGWILSFLFTFSVLKNYIWYSCFGVNILTYSTLQDIFAAFFDDFAIFLFLLILFLTLNIKIRNEEKLFTKIFFYTFLILLFLLISTVYVLIFKLIIPLVPLIFILVFQFFLYSEKKYLTMLSFFLFFLAFDTIINPLWVSYFVIKDTQNKKPIMLFLGKKSASENFSFEYNGSTISTSDKMNYLIGSNSNYFFLFNSKESKTMIYNKSDCKNIKATPFF